MPIYFLRTPEILIKIQNFSPWFTLNLFGPADMQNMEWNKERNGTRYKGHKTFAVMRNDLKSFCHPESFAGMRKFCLSKNAAAVELIERFYFGWTIPSGESLKL